MEGFTIIDGVVALVIVLSALLAYSRGLVREALAIAGWIVAGILAFIFAPQVEPLIKEVPVVGDFIADSCELSMIGAFAAVFAVALIVASLITPLFSSLVQRSALGGLDQGLGFLFGVARGVLLVAIAYFVYETVVTSQNIAAIDDSRSARVFSRMTEKVQDGNPQQALGWITLQYEELVSACDAPADAADPAATPETTTTDGN
ncbi:MULTISPECIES: CvpA family protein [Roseovarius]|uniref:CvpA family protein n=1 Tax=Roseovarius TaxID=74030 RepID=UPI001C0D8A8A|nr:MULTISPECIES: CvpA family protein [Roseovarius]MBU3259952.1 CvpA family protein [Roseovarius sp. PS-C2]MDW3119422.1 CvpA family protein [Roseovarius pacificus]